MKQKNEISLTVSELIASDNFKELKRLLAQMHPIDIAETFSELDAKEMTLAFRLLPKDTAADVFTEMDSDMQEFLISNLTENELAAVLDELSPDDAADIIEEMPANAVSYILKNTDAAMRKTINDILRYPQDSAGSIMTTEYVSLRRNMTVAEAFTHIRAVGLNSETVYNCYVTENWQLVGVASIKRMLITPETELISNIMNTVCISVKTTDDKEFVASQIKKYGFLAMPVTDNENRLVGIVTIDDAVGVIEDEATEDIQIMAAISPSEKPYLKTGVLQTWKQRIPWLLLLMVSATFTGMIISNFENALAACTALTAFIPMLMDTGGNSGSQASVTVIRSLALNEVGLYDVRRIVWKEFRVSLICGVTLAVVNYVKILLVDMLLFKTLSPENGGFKVALVVCLTLAVTVVCAKLVGCTLPLLAKKLKFDPAVMASPFITTAVDAVSLLVYFFIASAVLKL